MSAPRYFAVGDRLAADLGDGRCAILQSAISGEFVQTGARWELAPPIPADLLTPPAAPVVADRAERYDPMHKPGCMCPLCGDQSRLHRPTPTP